MAKHDLELPLPHATMLGIFHSDGRQYYRYSSDMLTYVVRHAGRLPPMTARNRQVHDERR